MCWCVLLSGTASSDVVKRSSSGLCHPPESNWYERTSNYQAFDSVEGCIESGGKLPKGITLASLREGQKQQEKLRVYQRSAFGHGWDDADGDCQDSRAEALIAQSTTKVRFADESRCRVVTGRWISPFTGQVIQNASDIDIDHVVPLKWAWERGARQWSRERRERFANDPVNLWSVELSLNRQKGAQGPWAWLPPANQCAYVARFLRLVKLYGLEPETSERRALDNLLADCR
ncbi:MAG: HNH endonuclease family protein [Marinobacter adhaerens]